jgi:hypothetical protein
MLIREKSHCTIFYHWIPETRNLRRFLVRVRVDDGYRESGGGVPTDWQACYHSPFVWLTFVLAA